MGGLLCFFAGAITAVVLMRSKEQGKEVFGGTFTDASRFTGAPPLKGQPARMVPFTDQPSYVAGEFSEFH